jgi:hypothetical protein
MDILVGMSHIDRVFFELTTAHGDNSFAEHSIPVPPPQALVGSVSLRVGMWFFGNKLNISQWSSTRYTSWKAETVDKPLQACGVLGTQSVNLLVGPCYPKPFFQSTKVYGWDDAISALWEFITEGPNQSWIGPGGWPRIANSSPKRLSLAWGRHHPQKSMWSLPTIKASHTEIVL